MNEKFFIEIKVEETWQKLKTSSGEVYEFSSREAAEKIQRLCYPDEFGSQDNVRIKSNLE